MPKKIAKGQLLALKMLLRQKQSSLNKSAKKQFLQSFVMMNPNNADGLIDLNTWQMHLKQLPDLKLFQIQSIKQIFADIPKYKDLQVNAIITLMCGHISRFDEVFAFYQEGAKRQISVEVYMPLSMKKEWSSYIGEKKCFITPVHGKKIEEKTQRWLYIDLLANLSSREVPAIAQAWIDQINAQDLAVVALDLPSGLDASSGAAIIARPLYADLVIGRIALMQGLYTGIAKACIGEIVLLNQNEALSINYQSFLLNAVHIASMIPSKPAYAYKGLYARILIIAGEKEMFGASLLAARAALMMGSGCVEVFYQSGFTPPYGSLPEIIWHEINDVNKILAAIKPHDILVFGPGLGEGVWGQSIWHALNGLDNKMVLDASALHYLAKSKKKRQNCIITPHPGEAALLLNTTNTDIQAHRFAAIKKIFQRFEAGVVLKGSGSLIYTQEQMLYVCPHGNPAMATQGMGDALTGLIAGLWSRLAEPSSAMLVAVCLHAKAADMMMQKNPDLLAIRASQVLDEIENHMQDILCK
ncbi:MAG: NAD(P)H-hydrate dehydratase [Gammaproteobacteria bacterium]|nr:NAD(P)H-hydrate dehydratase [Gammaproteobacteria bacterium]